jgi:hypothetical protein
MSTTTILQSSAFSTRRPARSIAAVFAGLVATFAVTTAVDVALHATRVYPPFGQRMSDVLFVLALAYRIPLDVAGSALAARLAPDRPLRHALALGVVGLALATVGAIAMGDQGPAWYAVANVVIALPCAIAGGWLVSGSARR